MRVRLRGVRRLRVVLAAGLGAGLSLLPAVAGAQGVDRTLDTPDDALGVVALTALGVAALLLVSVIGYLYRRQRGLHWDFQVPEHVDDQDEAAQ